MESAPLPGPGWYPDPNDPTTNRYWDGTAWTESRAPRQGVATGQTQTNGMAVASLVLGLVWVWGIGSVLAIIFGAIAKNQIRDAPGRYTGGGMATAGIVLGIIGVVIIAIVLIGAAASEETTFRGY